MKLFDSILDYLVLAFGVMALGCLLIMGVYWIMVGATEHQDYDHWLASQFVYGSSTWKK